VNSNDGDQRGGGEWSGEESYELREAFNDEARARFELYHTFLLLAVVAAFACSLTQKKSKTLGLWAVGVL